MKGKHVMERWDLISDPLHLTPSAPPTKVGDIQLMLGGGEGERGGGREGGREGEGRERGREGERAGSVP